MSSVALRATIRAAITAATLAAAWFGWEALGTLVWRVGLGGVDPVARVALGFAALSGVEAVLHRLRRPPS